MITSVAFRRTLTRVVRRSWSVQNLQISRKITKTVKHDNYQKFCLILIKVVRTKENEHET